jgi:hypothetical protein
MMNAEIVSAHELRSAGLVGNDRALASVVESLGVPGTGIGERRLTARLYNSIEFDVIPSRGFDIGDTWFRGIPISWFSPVSDARSLPSPVDSEWLTRFTGGLLTTCGFSTIGAAANGEGLHGRASHLPADEVAWSVADDGVELRGTVESVALFGPSFRLRRTISASTSDNGTAQFHVTDNVANIGPEAAPLSLMYHLNFGAPLVAPGTRVSIDSTGTVASSAHREVPDWRHLPTPSAHIAEAVFAHSGMSVAPDGFAQASIASSTSDLGVRIEWSATTLPHLHQWVFPTRGRWALGIEPATAPLFGAGREAAHAGAPVLEPGEMRSHELRISVGKQEAVLG